MLLYFFFCWLYFSYSLRTIALFLPWFTPSIIWTRSSAGFLLLMRLRFFLRASSTLFSFSLKRLRSMVCPVFWDRLTWCIVWLFFLLLLEFCCCCCHFEIHQLYFPLYYGLFSFWLFHLCFDGWSWSSTFRSRFCFNLWVFLRFRFFFFSLGAKINFTNRLWLLKLSTCFYHLLFGFFAC